MWLKVKKKIYKNKFFINLFVEASFKIFFIKILKLNLINFAISGTNDRGHSGCVFISSK